MQILLQRRRKCTTRGDRSRSILFRSHGSYRALAERYEHVSRELQKANNAISVAFPDQFQFGMEDEEAAIKPSAVKIKKFEKLPHQLATGVSSKRKTGSETSTTDKEAQKEKIDTDDELQKNLQSLEEEKIDTDGLSEKLRQEEEKLLKIHHLRKCLQEERSKQHIHFTEACNSFSDLADKLQFSEQKQDKVDDTVDDEQDLVTKQQVEESEENEIKQEESSSGEDEEFHSPGEIPLPLWQQLFLDGLDDSEKILLSEYTNVVRHFKDKMRKLAEEEMKNQDSLFRTSDQINQLGNTIVKRDDEIRLLQQKLNSLENGKNQHDEEEDDDIHSFAYHSCAISPQNEEASLKISDEREPGDGLHTKEKFRRDIDELLAENLEFWLRFSSSIRQIQIYRT